MRAKVHILNGPNLNLLGTRQPEIYGSDTLADIEARTRAQAEDLGAELTFAQTNSEGGLVDLIQAARVQGADIIVNAGAYTHTSVAVMDALMACDDCYIVELHLSSPHRREAFRHHSYVALAADAVIAGFGADGYRLALDAVMAKRRGD